MTPRYTGQPTPHVARLARTGDDVRVALAQELRPLQKHFALTLERPHVGAHDRLHTCTRIIAIHKSNPRTRTPCTGSGVNVSVGMDECSVGVMCRHHCEC